MRAIHGATLGLLDLVSAEKGSENWIQVRVGVRYRGPNITAGSGSFGVRRGWWTSVDLQTLWGPHCELSSRLVNEAGSRPQRVSVPRRSADEQQIVTSESRLGALEALGRARGWQRELSGA